MEWLKETIIFIENHSLLIVIAALGITFGVKWMNLFFKKKEYEFDMQKRKKENEVMADEHKRLMEKRNEISLIIEKFIEKVMYETNSCRAYVFEFHNGITPMGGIPFSKMTNTYEVLNTGASSELKSRENMPMQLYPTFVKAIYDDDIVFLDTENKDKKHSNIVYATLEARKISKTLACKLTDTKGRTIGYFGIDYCTGKKAPSDKKIAEITPIVQNAAIRLGALLSVDNVDNEKEGK